MDYVAWNGRLHSGADEISHDVWSAHATASTRYEGSLHATSSARPNVLHWAIQWTRLVSKLGHLGNVSFNTREGLVAIYNGPTPTGCSILHIVCSHSLVRGHIGHANSGSRVDSVIVSSGSSGPTGPCPFDTFHCSSRGSERHLSHTATAIASACFSSIVVLGLEAASAPVGAQAGDLSWLRIVGLALALVGIAFRLWAICTLGRFFHCACSLFRTSNIMHTTSTGPHGNMATLVMRRFIHNCATPRKTSASFSRNGAMHSVLLYVQRHMAKRRMVWPSWICQTMKISPLAS